MINTLTSAQKADLMESWAETFRDYECDTYERLHELATRIRSGKDTEDDQNQIEFHLNQIEHGMVKMYHSDEIIFNDDDYDLSKRTAIMPKKYEIEWFDSVDEAEESAEERGLTYLIPSAYNGTIIYNKN